MCQKLAIGIVDAVQVEHMKVGIQIKCRAKALNQSHGTALRTLLDGYAGTFDQECADDVMYDGERLAHHRRIGREKIA